jgi:hypothetical protein
MADQLADPADLASILQVASVDAYTATMLVEIGTAVVQAETGQRIVQVAGDVMELDLDEYDEGPYLVLPERPVTAVTAVLVGSTAVTDYVAQKRRSRLWRASGWRSTLVYYPDQPSTVTVTYTHGYPPGHQKLQLARGVVLSIIAGVYTNPGGASSVKIDDYAATYAAMERQLAASPNLVGLLHRQYGHKTGSVRLVTTSA